MRNVTAFADLVAGQDLGNLSVTVSDAANARYYRAVGIDHPALRAGALYPPIATNLTVLLFGGTCLEPVIQTAQRLWCHRIARASAELVTTGSVVARYEKRGRAYVDVRAQVATSDAPDQPVWTSEVSFTPAATLGAPS